MPFIKEENIFIVIWTKETLDMSNKEKGMEKGKIILKIKEKNEFDDIFLFEDRHTFIHGVNDMIPNTAHHFSEILD